MNLKKIFDSSDKNLMDYSNYVAFSIMFNYSHFGNKQNESVDWVNIEDYKEFSSYFKEVDKDAIISTYKEDIQQYLRDYEDDIIDNIIAVFVFDSREYEENAYTDGLEYIFITNY